MLELPDGATVHEALQRLGVPAALERVMLVNGIDATAERRLAHADVIDVFPPLAGGARGR